MTQEALLEHASAFQGIQLNAVLRGVLNYVLQELCVYVVH